MTFTFKNVLRSTLCQKALILCSIFFLAYCSEVEFNNPDDPRSPSYRGNVSSSSDGSGESSSSALVSSSSTAMVPSSSSVASSSSSAKSSSSLAVAVSSSSTPIVADCNVKGDTVRIGNQLWMNKNLNCNVSGSRCYNNQESNCDTYGRLYDWATAMNLPSSCNSSTCSSQINAKHQGICPSGWHIPNNDEWDALMTAVGGSSTAGTKLKSSELWNLYSGVPKGTDEYGFSALPGGLGLSVGGFNLVGLYGYWWSASEYNSRDTYLRFLYYLSEGVGYDDSGVKGNLQSVRCLQD